MRMAGDTIASASPPDDVFAATPEVAARLAGTTVAQLERWRHSGLVVPTVTRRLSPRNEVRLYDFAGVVELRILTRLREARSSPRLSPQHIRQVVTRLRAEYGRPLTELRYAVQGGELYFQHPDGSWEGGRRPGQLVVAEVIMLEEVRAELRSAARKLDREPGQIVRRRKVLGSKPTFAGTRIPVSAVRAYLDRGLPDTEILAAYPQLTEADIDAVRAAC